MKKSTRIILGVLLAALIILCVVLISARHSFVRDRSPQTAVTEAPPSASPIPSALPTEAPEEEWEPAAVRADNVGAVYTLLDRDSTVNVIGEYGDWYIATLSDNSTVYVEKRLVRLESEPAFSKYTGYTLWNAALYDNPYLENEPLKPEMNEELRVLDSLGNLLVVSYGDKIYCVRPDDISHDLYYYDPSGGSSGESTPSDPGYTPSDPGYTPSDPGGEQSDPGGGGEQSGADGEEIVLAAKGDYTRFISKLSTVSLQQKRGSTVGYVLMNNTEACVSVFDRDEIVRVTKWADDVCVITTPDGVGTIRTSLLRPSNDLPLEKPATAAAGECRFYPDYRMLSDPEILNFGTQLTVLDDIGGIYVVSVNGKLGYMYADDVNITVVRDPDSDIFPAESQSDPGYTPSDPGYTPSDPGYTPSDPGGEQSDPGGEQPDPGSEEWTPAVL